MGTLIAVGDQRRGESGAGTVDPLPDGTLILGNTTTAPQFGHMQTNQRMRVAQAADGDVVEFRFNV